MGTASDAVIGHRAQGRSAPTNTASTACTNVASGQRDQLGVVLTPQILGPVGQHDHPVRLQRLDRALIVGDQDDRPLIATDRVQHLLAGCRVQVVRGLVEQQDVGR
ncbi:hypothetical protein SDC9_95612 [bioreactor metagenome]|uniref:Uncharacterized protein n=1 Tax=bioreactor metagenome TaxID=1076179 RepID=A0A645A6T2_9ZZZZ